MTKLAVITGAGSGIGQETALYFAEKKWLTILLSRNQGNLIKTQNLSMTKSFVVSLDLKQPKLIRTAARQVLKIAQEIEPQECCLVNCAGVYQTSAIESLPLKDWNSTFQTNLFGAVTLTELLLPYFIKNRFGSIVNVSSTLGKKGIATAIPYCVSKAAMNHWTRCLALAVGQYNVRANAVCPGLVDTPIHDFHMLKDKIKAKRLRQLGKLQPLGRIGSPRDIAKAIYFLGSNESAWTTGALLEVDGGINLN